MEESKNLQLSQRILHTAFTFRQAADRCAVPVPVGPEQVEVLVEPMAVCDAFALELFLKAFLVAEGTPKRGHDLLSLFRGLPLQYQAEIADDCTLTHADMLRLFGLERKSFENWRYVYEANNDLMVWVGDMHARVSSGICRVLVKHHPSLYIRESALRGQGPINTNFIPGRRPVA